MTETGLLWNQNSPDLPRQAPRLMPQQTCTLGVVQPDPSTRWGRNSHHDRVGGEPFAGRYT